MRPDFKTAPALGGIFIRAWLLMAICAAMLALPAQPALAGTIVEASCPCGYHSGSLLIFGGRSNFKTHCAFPVYCQGCPSLKLANLYAGEPTCPDCLDQSALPYDHPSLVGKPGAQIVASWNTQEKLGRTLLLSNGLYLCPRCGDFSLSFKTVGMWD